MENEIADAIEEVNDPSKYQIFIANIHWDRKSLRQYHSKYDVYEDLPSQFTLDVPENVQKRATKSKEGFNDVIETYVYDFLTRKFAHEVNRCQIYLPLEEL